MNGLIDLPKEEKGLTLVELLVVVAVLLVLVAIAIPNFLDARKRSTLSTSKGNLKSISTAIESYATDNDQYPVQTAAGDVTGISGSINPTYIRPIPEDPSGGQYQYQTNAAGNSYVLWDPHTATAVIHKNSSGNGATAYVEEGSLVRETTGAIPSP